MGFFSKTVNTTKAKMKAAAQAVKLANADDIPKDVQEELRWYPGYHWRW